MPGPRRVRRRLRPRRSRTEPEGTCAVIVAAYRATRWITETLASIEAQRPREGWEYSLRLGVDGCAETSRFLLRSGVAHWWSEENVGPYVMRNSLIELEHASAYAIFDADDVMRPTYLEELLHWMGKDGIAGAARSQVDETGKLLARRFGYRSGVCVISHPAWAKVGSFRAWPVAADHDFILRARALRVTVQPVNKALYVRRVHAESLTNRKDVGFKSRIRVEFAKRARHLTKHRIGLYVPPITTPLELRTP